MASYRLEVTYRAAEDAGSIKVPFEADTDAIAAESVPDRLRSIPPFHHRHIIFLRLLRIDQPEISVELAVTLPTRAVA